MKSAPRLLDKIVGLTSLRDVELLEFSLLKTIHGHIRPSKLSLLKLNKRQQPIMQTDFVGDHCEIKHDGILVQAELERGLEHLANSRSQTYFSRTPDGVISIHLLQQTNRETAYLIMFSDEEISKLDNYLVDGFIQVHRNFCELLMESQTDELTGLANRKTFEDSIVKIHDMALPAPREFPSDKRCGQADQFWLAMIDVDHFKRVNDEFGHLYGDEVLILIAQLLKSCFREDDFVFRFGGEEFAAILRTPDRVNCEAMLQRLLQTVSEKEFPGVGNITVSIGAVQMTPDIFHATLLDYADQALYKSKHNGRNQVTFFEDMVSQGQASYEEIEGGDVDLF